MAREVPGEEEEGPRGGGAQAEKMPVRAERATGQAEPRLEMSQDLSQK